MLFVIDSGIGGLTISEPLCSTNIPVTYILDNAFFPYGSKSENEIEERLIELVGCYESDHYLIACNTATTHAIEILRDKYPKRVFSGVVPAVKPAAALSQSKKIAVLATELTSASAYLKNLIEEFASDCEVSLISAPEFVELSEQKLKTGLVDSNKVSGVIARIPDDVDVIVLGCTHFPFLKNEIQYCLQRDVEIIDSTDAVVRRVCHTYNGGKGGEKNFVLTQGDLCLEEILVGLGYRR